MAVKVMGGIKTTAARLLPRSATPVTPSQDARMPPPPSATYKRLRETIAERMRMGHIYQPLMLMELLGRHTQDVARRILGSAWWAGFTFNGITRCEKGTVALVGGEELSDAELDQLLALNRKPSSRH